MSYGRLSTETFGRKQGEVLRSRPAGAEVDPEEGVPAYRALTPERAFASLLEKAAEEGRVLLQRRAGVVPLEQHVQLLRYRQEEANLLRTTIDGWTEQNRYDRGQERVKRS
jgi:glutamate mutase epsilon subunit